MDIIDIILAKKLTPQGQIETYAQTSQQAVARANQAIANVEAAAQDIEEKQTAAQELLTQAQEALETAQQTQINMPEVYSTTGQNTDGYMTQKAVTDALDTKASVTYVNTSLSTKVDNSVLNNYATVQYVNTAVGQGGGNSGSGSGGISNLGIDANGKIVIVGPDGNIMPGEVDESAIIQALIKSDLYIADGTVGISIDYENKNIARTQDAINYRMGNDFNAYVMYGGRMRCNVADDGTINAFYGDANYTEDGSNGQVMIYQPKFYYQRVIIKDTITTSGIVINKESLILSDQPRNGFILHPLFKQGNIELDYVLLPAYEGSIYNTDTNTYLVNDENNVDASEDKLSSIAGVKPFSTIDKQFTLQQVKQLARNRGEGWQLTNTAFESALQMLASVEFGSLNGQTSLEKGITEINKGSAKNCSAITGSTTSLGNTSGMANSTIFDKDGTQTTYSENGSRAISYRGMENPWGNLWRIIDDLTLQGNGYNQGGIPYLDTVALNFQLPSVSGKWISAMGYSNSNYLWIYLPIACADTANSAIPVGDALWTNTSLNGTNLVGIGGMFNSNSNSGLYYYCGDIGINTKLQYFNGRIMYIPAKNAIYNSNITKWRQHYGG